jgi:hypothetical protein
MNTTKSEIRAIALEILFSPNPPHQMSNLERAIVDALVTKGGYRQQMDEFSGENWLIFSEVFWDLITDKIITPGWDISNAELPWFRLHSQANENVKRAAQARKP